MQRSNSSSRSFYLKRLDEPSPAVKAHQLYTQFLKLDKLLGSRPISEHHTLDFDSIRQSDTDTDAVDDEAADPERQSTASNLLAALKEHLKRPDSIPAAFIQAYQAALAGRQYVNQDLVVNFRLGRECTCSEALRACPIIDRMAGTSLGARFDTAYSAVKPFPLLSLPAELRLHIYDYHLPWTPYLSVWDKPVPAYTPPLLDLSILRANRQLYAELSEHLYKDRLLYMQVCRGYGFEELRLYSLSRCYEVVANMSKSARESFTHLEITLGHASQRKHEFRRYTHIPEVDDPFPAILALLPNLERVLVSFSKDMGYAITPRLDRKPAARWLAGNIPTSLTLQWDFDGWKDTEGLYMIEELMESRGGLQLAEGVSHICFEEMRKKRPPPTESSAEKS